MRLDADILAEGLPSHPSHCPAGLSSLMSSFSQQEPGGGRGRERRVLLQLQMQGFQPDPVIQREKVGAGNWST